MPLLPPLLHHPMNHLPMPEKRQPTVSLSPHTPKPRPNPNSLASYSLVISPDRIKPSATTQPDLGASNGIQRRMAQTNWLHPGCLQLFPFSVLLTVALPSRQTLHNTEMLPAALTTALATLGLVLVPLSTNQELAITTIDANQTAKFLCFPVTTSTDGDPH
eukprot:jgi/Psemu1/20589/gm1.20589_g